MLNSLCRIGLTAALFGLLFVPSVSLAQDKRVRHVEDNAKLFSKDAVSQADAIIAKIKEKHKKDLLIETVAEGPEKDFNGWAKARFNNAAVDGVYVVLVKTPKEYHIDVGDQTLSQGYFTRADIKELEKIITKQKKGDKELLSKIATYTLETMNERHKPKAEVPAKKKAAPVQNERPAPVARDPVHNDNHKENTMPPWVGWVCMIVAVLFVVWIVFAIIRAMTGAMGGGYGGGGYGGGGYGGGGGGFMTGMLGGLFGAMAGMWIYNSMFGGHAHYMPNGSVDWGGGAGGADGGAASQTDADVGASAGGEAEGGDWGGGGGDGGAADGGDAGGGGGDWGGKGGDVGGDAGGGDWGGGGDAGGDWGGGDGGGGGGDWGGGGGGDFGGGGGGDW